MRNEFENSGSDDPHEDKAWDLHIPDVPDSPDGVAPGSLEESLAAERLLFIARQFREGQVAAGETPVSEEDIAFMRMTADMQTPQLDGLDLEALRRNIDAIRSEEDEA